MSNANYFDTAGDYDFYERSAFGGRNGQDCLDGIKNLSYLETYQFMPIH